MSTNTVICSRVWAKKPKLKPKLKVGKRNYGLSHVGQISTFCLSRWCLERLKGGLDFRLIVCLCETLFRLVSSEITSWELGLWPHVSPLAQPVSSSSCLPPAWAQQSAPSLHPGDCAETCAKEFNIIKTHTQLTHFFLAVFNDYQCTG